MAHPLLPKLWGDDNGRDVFSNLHREIDRVFEDFTGGNRWPFPAMTGENGKMTPSINVSETDSEIEITAEMPGVEEKEIDVSLTDDIVTIKAEKKSETEKSEKDYRLMERSYGMYERSLRLPCEVKVDKVQAAFKNGVLKITMPKSSETKAKTQKITVQAH
jgi:HSP20 family protein